MRQLSVAAVLLSVAWLPRPARAHDTWLLPSRPAIEAGSRLELEMTSGMQFPALESAIKPERVQTAECRLGGRRLPLEAAPGEKALSLSATLPVAGTAVCRVDLAPRALELTPPQVEEYLEEIGAPAALRQAWAAEQGKRPWREIYSKHSKTAVAVGDAGGDPSWSEPLGSALEIVLECDPARLAAGSELAVRLLKNGQPLAGLALSFVAQGEEGALVATDAQGRARSKLTRAGWWLVRATELRRVERPDATWESDFATLTLFVRSAP